jgi:hypothetical protein
MRDSLFVIVIVFPIALERYDESRSTNHEPDAGVVRESTFEAQARRHRAGAQRGDAVV